MLLVRKKINFSHFRSPFSVSDLCERSPIKPSNSCGYIKYKLQTTADKCKAKKSVKLCSIAIETATITDVTYSFNCSFISRHCQNSSYGVMNPKLGRVSYTAFPDTSQIEPDLWLISKKVGFVFIRCTLTSRSRVLFPESEFSYPEKSSDLGQLIWFLKPVGIQHSKHATTGSRNLRGKKKPNINILFLDSTSRTNFYYVMNESVKWMKELSSQSER